MKLAALIGDPVAHSLSPVMHNAAFAHLGIDARYELWHTSLGDLADRVAGLRSEAILGANVTVPYKHDVLPLVDEVSETARRIGAVNTIIPRDGRLLGDNTDAYGFVRSLEKLVPLGSLSSVLIVGAGGASRALLVSLQDAGVPAIHLLNRTVARAESLVESLAGADLPQIQAHTLDALPALARTASVLVNATSVGWHGDELPFDQGIIDALPNSAVVMDLTYRTTALIRQATARGLRTLDGLPMLIYQGARSFELWTGQQAPVEIMTEAVRQEQARRA